MIELLHTHPHTFIYIYILYGRVCDPKFHAIRSLSDEYRYHETKDYKLCHVIHNNKLATVVEGDQKATFSIATTPWCWERCYSFPWIAPLYS